MASGSHNGWLVWFSKNVHMWNHNLRVEKNGHRIDIPCEDIPDGGGAIWIYDLELEESLRQDQLTALREWATDSGLKWRIYTSRLGYETINLVQ